MDLRRYELATLAAARSLRSSYCCLAHGSVLLDRFAEPVREIALDHRTAGLDEVDVAVMDLAERVVSDATSIEDADLQRLRTLGLRDDEIMDVVLAAARAASSRRRSTPSAFAPTRPTSGLRRSCARRWSSAARSPTRSRCSIALVALGSGVSADPFEAGSRPTEDCYARGDEEAKSGMRSWLAIGVLIGSLAVAVGSLADTRAQGPAALIFASDRAPDRNPEVYSLDLARGARLDLSRDDLSDTVVAVQGRQVAFESDRRGLALYVARAGSATPFEGWRRCPPRRTLRAVDSRRAETSWRSRSSSSTRARPRT